MKKGIFLFLSLGSMCMILMFGGCATSKANYGSDGNFSVVLESESPGEITDAIGTLKKVDSIYFVLEAVRMGEITAQDGVDLIAVLEGKYTVTKRIRETARKVVYASQFMSPQPARGEKRYY